MVGRWNAPDNKEGAIRERIGEKVAGRTVAVEVMRGAGRNRGVGSGDDSFGNCRSSIRGRIRGICRLQAL